MRGETVATYATGIVDYDIKRTLGGDARIELLQGTGAGVPRICKSLEPSGFLTSVKLDKTLARHIRLTAHFKLTRRVWRENFRDGLYRAYVRRYVVAYKAVAARRGTDEPSAGVAKRKRDTVNLRFNEISKALDSLPDKRIKLGKLIFSMRLVQ